MSRKFTVPIELPEMAATPTTPASGYGSVYAKTDGLPYWLGDDGVERPLIPAISALHTNPGFEGAWASGSNGTPTVIGLKPPGWTLFWCADGVTTTQEVTDKTEGAYAVQFNKPAGAGKTSRLHSETVFACSPGDVVTFDVDARAASGASGTFYISLLSSSTQAGCDYFSGDPYLSSSSRSFLLTSGGSYGRCRASFVVPTGCSWSRFSLHYETNADAAGVLRFDNSASTRTTPASGTTVMTGSMLEWPLTAAPAGYLKCDGTTYLDSAYPTLAALLKSEPGSTDFPNGPYYVSATQFKVPDLLGRFPIGVNPTAVAYAKVPGMSEATTAGTARENRLLHLHDHTIPAQAGTGILGVTAGSVNSTKYADFNGHSHGGVTGDKGLNNSTGNTHPYFTVNYCIKT